MDFGGLLAALINTPGVMDALGQTASSAAAGVAGQPTPTPTPTPTATPATVAAQASAPRVAPANSISRSLSGGWQPLQMGSGNAPSVSSAGPTWQDYENYYNRKQGVPTAYSAPAPQQAPVAPQAPAVDEQAQLIAALQQILGNFHLARGGIADSLPYTQRRG